MWLESPPSLHFLLLIKGFVKKMRHLDFLNNETNLLVLLCRMPLQRHVLI